VEVVVRAIGEEMADVEDDVVGGCFGKFWDWSAVRAEKGRWGARAGSFIVPRSEGIASMDISRTMTSFSHPKQEMINVEARVQTL
jgi:hypothetical protein